jgi:hypothetical protein
MKIDDSSLQQLLRAAGRSGAPPPDVRPDLADRVHRLHARRRRARKALGGLLAMTVLLAGATWMVYHAVGPARTTNNSVADRTKPSDGVRDVSPADEVQRLRAEIAELAAEARRRERVIEEVIRRQRLREQIAHLERQFNQPDPLEVVRLEIEKTAFLLVNHAETRSFSSPDSSSGDEYRRILEYFPGTNGARTAQMKLKELNTNEGDL